MRRAALLACVIAFPCPSGWVAAEDVSSRIETTARGERILIQTVWVSAPLAAVRDAYTTAEGWRRWVVEVVEMDFRSGGLIQTHHDPKARIGDEGTNRLRVVNYVPHKLVTLQAEATSSWPEFMKVDARNLYNVILFQPVSESRTRVDSYGVGYGPDARYEDLLRSVVIANERTLRRLKGYLEAEAGAPRRRGWRKNRPEISAWPNGTGLEGAFTRRRSPGTSPTSRSRGSPIPP